MLNKSTVLIISEMIFTYDADKLFDNYRLNEAAMLLRKTERKLLRFQMKRI